VSDGYGEFKRDLNRLALGAIAVGILCVVPARVRVYLLGLVGTVVLWAFSLDHQATLNQRSPWTVWSYVWAVVFVTLLVCLVVECVQDHRRGKLAQAQPAFVPAPQQSQRPAPRPVTRRVERTVRVERSVPTTPAPQTAPPPQPARSSIIVVTNTHKPVRRAELQSGIRINDRRGFDPEMGA